MPNATQHQGTRGKVANNRETMCQKPTTPLRWARTRYDFINSSYFSTKLFLLELRARLYQEGTGSGARKAHIITLQPAGEAFIFLAALHSRSIAHTAMPSPLLPGTRWVVHKKWEYQDFDCTAPTARTAAPTQEWLTRRVTECCRAVVPCSNVPGDGTGSGMKREREKKSKCPVIP